MAQIIGVDIGGSHITSACVDALTNKIIPETIYFDQINKDGAKDAILQSWGKVLNKTIGKLRQKEQVEIGIAMPGPFDYQTGTAFFEGNHKYESLYGVSVAKDLLPYLDCANVSLRFLNDASSFGMGATLIEKNKNKNRIVAITLGTGFGAAFIDGDKPLTQGENIPKEGCLWNKPYLNGIADDYFSTRWFINRYEELTGDNSLKGVKEILEVEESVKCQIFSEFAENLSDFLLSYIQRFEAEGCIFGGNITKSASLFLPIILNKWRENKIHIPVSIIENSEEANIVGASFLFNDSFWKNIQKELPNL